MTVITVQQQTVQRVTTSQQTPITIVVRPTGPQGPPGPMTVFGTVDKRTGIDGGFFGEMSIMDDYLYVCVKAGGAGVAIWKKTLLFTTL